MVAVPVHLVVGDREIIRVIVGIKSVQNIIAHGVVRPNPPIVTVAVHPVVHAVNLGIVDITINAGAVKHFGVGQVGAEATNLPGKAIALAIEKAQVAHDRVDDVLTDIES